MDAHFSLAYAKNPRQVAYKTFAPEGLEGPAGDSAGNSHTQVIDWRELKFRPVEALLFPRKALEAEEWRDCLATWRVEQPHLPLWPLDAGEMDAVAFERLGAREAQGLLERASGHWCLQNNLHLLEHFFPRLEHLNELLANDRSAFFEELWQLLKNNLAARQLKVAYRHPNSRGKTSRARMTAIIVEGAGEGGHIPNSVENRKAGEALLQRYVDLVNSPWCVHQYCRDSGQLTALARVGGSPVIIMAISGPLSALQRALLKSLFEGLERYLAAPNPPRGSPPSK